MSTTEHIALVPIEVMVNGQRYRREVEPRLLLVQLLREELRLTGTHIGCDTTYCGACTVQLNGAPVKSCTVLAVQAQGAEVTTIEGIGSVEHLHPLQEAFRRHHALQCGYCTPGMVMQGIDIVRRGCARDEVTVRHELEGNLCRCTGYQGIVEAILDYAGSEAGAAKQG